MSSLGVDFLVESPSRRRSQTECTIKEHGRGTLPVTFTFRVEPKRPTKEVNLRFEELESLGP